MIDKVCMNLISTMKKTLLCAILIAFCGHSWGATYYVDSNFQGESPTGESWFSAFPSLDAALEKASTNKGSQIWIRAGHYRPEGTSKDATFQVPEGTALYGGFRGGETNLVQRNAKANRTVLSGDIGRIGSIADNAYHVVTASANTVIDGFTIQRGNATSIAENRFGGGLRIEPGSKNVLVANCTFEKNSAESGGALHLSLGEMVVSNCTFYSNSAETGGALAILGESNLQVIDSTFSSNFAPKLGGAMMLNEGANVEISNSRFLYNSTDDFGGAIAAVTKKDSGIFLNIQDSSFNQNSARNNGGALGFSGSFAPAVIGCSFEKNFSPRGAGAIANRSGTTTILLQASFAKNQGSKGMENVGSDESSRLVETQEEADTLVKQVQEKLEPAEPVVAEPEPEPETRKLADVFVHQSKDNAKVKLRSIVSDAPHTVLVLGDLTDDDFITSFQNVEAAARDFYPKGIRFYYIYKYLKHPENNGYIKPFSSRARSQHTVLAKEHLQTAVPWLYDTMENETAEELRNPNGANLFIFSKNGEEVYRGTLADERPFRAKLAELSSPVEKPFNKTTLPEVGINPITLPESKLVPRAKVSINDKFKPLEITPQTTRAPFYVKARVEGSEELLKSGDGKLYLGFHIDPLFKVQWNNLGEPIKYQLKIPQGVVAPSINSAARVTAVATDSEPREFILQARKLDLNKPLNLQVTYSIHTQAKKNVEVTQNYLIYLQKDKFGGEVIGRQVSERGKEEAKAEASGASNSAFKAMLRRYDIDRNGKLTKDEVIGRLRSLFDEIDTNKDGAIDANEYNEYRQKRR